MNNFWNFIPPTRNMKFYENKKPSGFLQNIQKQKKMIRKVVFG